MIGKIQAAMILYFFGIYLYVYQKLYIELIEYSLQFWKDFRAIKSIGQLEVKMYCLKKFLKANQVTFERARNLRNGTGLSKKAI